jgi:acetyltransferase
MTLPTAPRHPSRTQRPPVLAPSGRMAPSGRPTPADGAREAIERPHTVRLDDGRSAVLRPVKARDAAAEAAFIERLSPQSRRLRFHGAVNRLPAATLAAMTSVDPRRQVAFVAKGWSRDGRSEIVADARFVFEGCNDGAACDHAEFALAVADTWQGAGLGRLLLQHLLRAAKLRGLHHLRGSVLADNTAMRGLVGRLGGQLEPDPFDASLVVATLTA